MRIAHLPIIKHKRGMHSLRHTMASMLLEKDTPLSTISDILGHVDLKTTEAYAKADTEMKRKAIENVHPDLIDPNLPDWNKDQALLSWLSEIQ